MHLVEILLPVADNEGRPFAAHKYADVREELTRRFGGITAFTRAPAQGSITPRERRCMTTSSFSRS